MINIQYINLILLLLIIIYLAWKLENINIFSFQNQKWKLLSTLQKWWKIIYDWLLGLWNKIKEIVSCSNNISFPPKCKISKDIEDIITRDLEYQNQIPNLDTEIESDQEELLRQIEDDNLLAQKGEKLPTGVAGSAYPPTNECYYQDFELNDDYQDVQIAENKFTDFTRNDTKCMDDDLRIQKIDVFVNSPQVGMGKKISEIYDDLVENQYSPNDLCSDEEKVVVNTDQVIDEFLYPPHQSQHLKLPTEEV